MASSIVKGVSSLLTPLKTSSLNLVSSPINNKGKFLSVTSIKPALKSPNFESRFCKTSKHKPYSALTEKRSPHQFKAARCLFSPPRSPKPWSTKRLYPATDKINRQDTKPPSFDTPLRKSIFSAEFYKSNTEGFILGRGSYGVVVEGRYKNKNIAVKIMSRCHERNEMLISEMNALKLNHPNLIKVFQVVVEPDKNIGFVFMELYCSMNLESLLQNQTVNQMDKIRYLKQIGNALQYCHSNSILHLDVKPKNIIVKSKDKTCKLCDYGSSVNTFEVNRNNPRKGTLKYSAPELLKGDSPTEKSDVYSFGITMWQTIYQELPYGMEDLDQVVYKVVKYNYRPVSCATVDNTAVRHIYEACWHAVPHHRPSMSQVVQMMK